MSEWVDVPLHEGWVDAPMDHGPSVNVVSVNGKDVAPQGKTVAGSLPGAVVQGVRDPITGIAQMLYNAVPEYVRNLSDASDRWLAKHTGGVLGNSDGGTFNQKVSNDNAAYEASRKENGRGDGVDWGRTAGNVVGMIPAAIATDGSAIPSFAGKIALSGATAGAAMPVTDQTGDFWAQKGKQTAVGAVTGVAGGYGAKVVGATLNPVISAGKKALLDAGISLTPGQLLGGFAKSAEDKLTSAPIIGDIINGAKGRGVSSLNTAVYERVLSPLKKAGYDISVPKSAGREAVESVSGQVSAAYDDLLPKLSFKADAQFTSDLVNIQDMAMNLPEQQAAQFAKILKNNLFSKMTPQGNMSGESLKVVESDLGKLARGYQSDAMFDNRQLGDAIQETLATIRGSLQRTNPEFATKLMQVNESYANLARLQKAAAATGAKEGVFSPAQLSQAVRSSDGSVRKNAYAQGKAFMQDLSDPAKAILPNEVPDSGTAGRALLSLLLGAGGYAIHPGIPAAAGLASLPYTKFGQKVLTDFATKRPDVFRAMGQVITNNAGKLGMVGVPALQGFSK